MNWMFNISTLNNSNILTHSSSRRQKNLSKRCQNLIKNVFNVMAMVSIAKFSKAMVSMVHSTCSTLYSTVLLNGIILHIKSRVKGF